MEPQNKVTPYFFFITLGVLISLITSVSAFLNLVFETLNQVFPDVLTDSYMSGYYSYTYDSIRNALALVIIVFPIYLVLERLWRRASMGELAHVSDTLRRWALYLILFLTSVTAIVDLVTLVRYFVSGEITTRFIIKVAVVFVVAGIVGWYYIRRLRNPLEYKWGTMLAIGSGVIILAAVVWAFTVIGGPGSQRTLRLDQRRLEDLQSIQSSIITYWQQSENLPATLAALSTPLSGYRVPRDPEFQKGNVYEYSIIRDKTFELCATFAAPLPEGWVINSGSEPYAQVDNVSNSKPFPGTMTTDSWQHGIGRTCFERTIDPVFYPPFPKQSQ